MDESLEKVGALEGGVGGQEADGWDQVARIEEMLDQVFNVDSPKTEDHKADTAYMFTVAHKDITQDLYGSTTEVREQARKATTHYI